MLYDEAFFNHRRNSTLESARTILRIIRAQYRFESVVDIGCGTGTWLTVAKELGALDVCGFEGPWLKVESIDDPNIEIERVDLEETLPFRKADLAICLEVAEHLSHSRANSLISELCSMAPCVVFGAAIPHQGGIGHINLEWQTVWAKRFEQNGFYPRDIVRPQIWDIESIPYWYRQNLIVYVRSDLASEFSSTNFLMPLDLVHPILLEEIARSEPGLKERATLALGIPSLFFRKLKIR